MHITCMKKNWNSTLERTLDGGGVCQLPYFPPLIIHDQVCMHTKFVAFVKKAHAFLLFYFLFHPIIEKILHTLVPPFKIIFLVLF